MEKKVEEEWMGEPLDVMELMAVRGGAGRRRKVCVFRVGVKDCNGDSIAVVDNHKKKKCKGKSHATPRSERRSWCLGAGPAVKCEADSIAVVYR